MFQSEVLQIRPFRRLWLGQAVSQFGDALYFLLFLFMVDKITGSAAMVGYVGALQALPFLLFGPVAGAVADRFDRRRVMLFADIASAFLLTALTVWLLVTPKPPVAVILGAAFLLSLVNVFFIPAKSAAIPALVPADRLMEANALSMATQNLMPLLGLGLSGTVLGVLYKFYPNLFFPTAAFVNAATFLYSAVCIAKLPRLLPKREEVLEKHPLQDAADGFRLIGRDHILKVSLALSLFLNLFISPFMVVYVAANRAWFGGQFGTLAAFEASFVAMMVITSLALGKRPFLRPGLGFSIGLGAIGLFVAAMAFSKSFWLFLFWNMICGIALPFAILPMNTYIQLVVPDAFRGRVNSAQTMVSMGVQPLSVGLAGMLLDRIGLEAMFLVMGVGMGASALIGLLDGRFRQTRMPAAEQTTPSQESNALSESEIPAGNVVPCES